MAEPLALLYDIHGNLPALDAVLEDVRATGAERILLGGDYGLFGPWPAETVARLRELDGPTWIRGNVDRWTLEGVEDETAMEAVEVCRRELGEATVRELGSLPPARRARRRALLPRLAGVRPALVRTRAR